FGSIKNIASTLASRVIPVVMVRTSNKEIKNRDIEIHDPIFQELRDQLYLVMMNSHAEILNIYKTLEDKEIVGREWELWKPILTVAMWLGEDQYQNIRTLAIEIQSQKKINLAEDILTPKLLEILLGLFTEDEVDFFSNSKISSLILDSLENPYYEDFEWLRQAKNPSRWIGGELRKAGVVKGHAIQKKVGSQNVRGHYLKKEVIKKRLEAYQST
ncbi:MAG: hypothetical protein Q8O97_01585, partial [bacterium]|nr:hypothetical protein [bacterium]